jgi:hypothetical protein
MGCAGGAGPGTEGLEPLQVSSGVPAISRLSQARAKKSTRTRDDLHALGVGAQLLLLGPFYVRMARQCGVHLRTES